MENVNVDVVVIGAGAGGFGSVYRLAKGKKQVAVIDILSDFGGTAVFAGVNCWEPGVSGPGVHRKLAKILLKGKMTAGVGKFIPNINIGNLNTKDKYNMDWNEERRDVRPYVLSATFKHEKYVNTEKRCCVANEGKKYYRRFHFESQAMLSAMNKILKPYERYIKRFFNCKYIGCECDGNKIKSVTVVTADKKQYRIIARFFIDCTGDVSLARDAGVKASIGTDSKKIYNEPSCKESADDSTNGVTQMFIVKKTSNSDFITQIPEYYKKIDITEWKEKVLYKDYCIGFFNVYPDLSININMLPTMEGKEYLNLKENAKDVCIARVYAYWNYLQTKKGLKGFDIIRIFDQVGVRESYRVKGKYVLTEKDIRKGYLNQDRREEFIAYSDHCLDVHGENGLGVDLDTPFGIPLSCAMVEEYDNLFIASKGLSLSHIASSSCRLTRTIMTIGEGVGQAICNLIDDSNIDLTRLRKQLKLKKYEKSLSDRKMFYKEYLKSNL